MNVTPSQILYLEHGSSRLYVEAVQVVPSRQVCWSRPMLLIQDLPYQSDARARQGAIDMASRLPERSPLQMYDLEGSPDLIWPVEMFQMAYDLSFFSLLVHLKMTPDLCADKAGYQQLNAFIQSCWKDHHSLSKQPPSDQVSSGVPVPQ